MWGTMRRIVGITISYMKDQEAHIKFKEKYNRKELLRSLTLQEEKTSTLAVDSEEEYKVEAWVEVEVRSFVITMHSQVTWQGTVRTLIPLVAIATHLNMLSNIGLCC
jgi:hypothetical protein